MDEVTTTTAIEEDLASILGKENYEAIGRLVDKNDKDEDKHVYFLLASAAAALAYAMQRTASSTIAIVDVPFFIAIACWAGSFAAGIINRVYNMTLAKIAMVFLSIEPFRRAEVQANPSNAVLEKERADRLTKFLSDKTRYGCHTMVRCYYWQLYLLAIGALSFVVWHVAGMIQRTSG